MTELAAFVMALMLTVELGLAIAFGAAWLAHPGRGPPALPGSANISTGSPLGLRITQIGGTAQSDWDANHPV